MNAPAAQLALDILLLLTRIVIATATAPGLKCHVTCSCHCFYCGHGMHMLSNLIPGECMNVPSKGSRFLRTCTSTLVSTTPITPMPVVEEKRRGSTRETRHQTSSKTRKPTATMTTMTTTTLLLQQLAATTITNDYINISNKITLP